MCAVQVALQMSCQASVVATIIIVHYNLAPSAYRLQPPCLQHLQTLNSTVRSITKCSHTGLTIKIQCLKSSKAAQQKITAVKTD